MLFKNFNDVLFFERFKVDVICSYLIRHDGGRVAVDQGDLDTFLL